MTRRKFFLALWVLTAVLYAVVLNPFGTYFKMLKYYIRFAPYFASYYFAGPAPKIDCSEGPGFKYCVAQAPEGVLQDEDSLLYFMHPINGSETSWKFLPYSRVYYAVFKKRGLPAPRVVTVSYGSVWTLFDKAGPKSPALFPVFVDKSMPWIESRIGRPKRRYVWGTSGGGLNAASLILKRPDLWAGGMLSCPTIYTVSVFAAAKEIDGFMRRANAERGTLEGIHYLRDRLAGPEEWKREDPLLLAASTRGLPPIYIDCTSGDEFGFHEGSARISAILRAHGADVKFRSQPGSHCRLDSHFPVNFLADLNMRATVR